MAAIALQLRPKCIFLRNPGFVHLFSSSSDNNDGEDKKNPQSPQSSPMSSYFSEVKASLRESSSLPSRRLSQEPLQDIPSFSPSKPTDFASLQEIRKNLSEYRFRSAPPSPDQQPSSSKTVSFQELYKRNVIEKGEEGSNGIGKSGKYSFDTIRGSLMKLRNSTVNQNQSDRMGGNKVLNPYSLKTFKDILKITPTDGGLKSSNFVMGGSETVPPMFRKDLTSIRDANSQYLKNDFLKSYGELGEKLRKLRPIDTKVGKNWFSLKELNERLKKLREIEEKESESRIGDTSLSFKELRTGLQKLTFQMDNKPKKLPLPRLDILGQLGGTPNFMLDPPKEQLVEKFFHPDNMSSAEKLKLELKKVRDEFKMSESDCGSSRVQVAQLTTKIKHLSSVLHKKDKHSRKGLQEMVQRRKKLLRYLRRTDWDSYCFCLSKLGLRDNPDYKN